MMIVVGGPVATNYTSATDNLHCHATTLLGGTYLTATDTANILLGGTHLSALPLPPHTSWWHILNCHAITLLGGTHLNATLFTGIAYFALAYCTT